MNFPPSLICVDANIFVSALISAELQHRLSALSLSLIEKRSIEIFVPTMVVFEVTSSLYKKCYNHEITEKDRNEAAEIFLTLPLLLEWQPILLKKAMRFATQMKRKKIYDCVYLAVASNRGIPLLTNDEALLKNGKNFYPEIFSPAEFCDSFFDKE